VEVSRGFLMGGHVPHVFFLPFFILQELGENGNLDAALQDSGATNIFYTFDLITKEKIGEFKL
jgi:hypothetical protein